MSFIKNFSQDESGAVAIEYGLIAALVAVALITAMTNLGTGLSDTFGAIATKITDVKDNI